MGPPGLPYNSGRSWVVGAVVLPGTLWVPPLQRRALPRGRHMFNLGHPGRADEDVRPYGVQAPVIVGAVVLHRP